MTHYQQLGVSRTADAGTIRRAYLEAARRAHPDRPTGDEMVMRQLNAAWAVLSDPQARAAYDRTLARPTPIPPQSTFVPPDRRFSPHAAYDGVDDDDDPMDLDDDGDPSTNPGGAALVLPVVFWLAAFVCTVYGLIGGVFPLVALGFILAVLGGVGFLAAPLMALGKASSAERASEARGFSIAAPPGDAALVTGTYLDRILDVHRARSREDDRRLDQVIDATAGMPPCRGFRRSLVAGTRLAVIAEIKRRSPSKGDLRADLDPVAMAQDYEEGGASCLSVLTDGDHFGGSSDDLAAARSAVTVPVLRKDFTVSPLDVCDARLMGADAVLLIVAALDDHELVDLSRLAVELGLDVLVETHDEAEVDRALVSTSGDLIGVNQRDLVTFQVDQARAIRVASVIPAATVKVAESGVRGRADAVALAAAGYHAVLVGEHLVTAEDPRSALAALRGPTRLSRFVLRVGNGPAPSPQAPVASPAKGASACG